MRSRADRTEPGTSGTVHACLRVGACPLERRTITVRPADSAPPPGSPAALVARGHAVIVGHTQRVLQLVRGLRLFEGIISLPRSRETSPRHPDPLQRRFREPSHTATPVQPIGN
ncbi:MULTISPECIES: hypothetical protein [unclassified Streptomyces]|uniref:hypothetical protein n=1 Tax=unclassified Streptomyces TaxID=2593676 RepID=UPI0013A6EB6B|nr:MULTISPECIES: hypothetical protein [unclassified Streptomyces]